MVALMINDKYIKKDIIMRNRIKNRMNKSRRDDISSTVGFNPRSIIMEILVILLIMVAGCEETKRYEISGGDSTPPGRPIFIDSEPLPGGARIFFRPPADEDVLSIEAAYSNAAGKKVRFVASYFAKSLDVYGFDSEGEHTIEMYAVDRAGNRSTSIYETVTSLEPPVVSVANTIQVLPSFASMLLKWNNLLRENLHVSVDFSFTQGGVRRDYTTVFASHQSETRAIENLNLQNDEPVTVKVNISDKYGNIVPAADTIIILLTDGVINKAGWGLRTSGSVMDDAVQAKGTNLEAVIDGENDAILPGNYFITDDDNPWNIMIDLGDRYEISRIVTHQRRSGGNDTRGNLYQGDNVMAYNLYGWNDTRQNWEWWLRHSIIPPVVRDISEYETFGREGDMTFIYPEVPKFSKPTRWIRFEAIDGKYISEITLYGRKAQ